ncbi:PEP-utilizing enzyme [Croceicoccus bisphenolivorans]|uniref:PEP-utilizing enzyme n=1 Tax=Croceicoccus bisphenolivorans TaxID=1783232 RepID=UPI000AC4787F|nr:PEP-utilizing enzyme [Croceicoccus bisphenolivorans]
MKNLPIDELRHAGPEATPLAEAILALVRGKVRDAYAASGQDWALFAMSGNTALVDAGMMQDVERSVLASGYRFDWSAAVSVGENPAIYKPGPDADGKGDSFMFEHPDAPVGELDENGMALCGVGDNVVRHARNVTGTARYIRSNERVLQYLTDGVPPGTIAVIDDSGGTLTAPIIDQFAGVICAGGTVRSHLGILSREYNIPCLMNAKVTGIRDGDTVTIEASADAKTAEDYQEKIDRTGKVWRHEGGAA